ncbi:sensor histidine kinase [Breznakiella homolactica]|uniref:GHKL domain-containing protein n=1 Tax=Breznakiella homolactica TaxID=2798577 RepID=A0A7T7XMW8_9SPIR|nr:ATP-binding protein [Breznakiella homolactica]QQO09233.1 GHKL domain-containing protein [Breznakiella homolactica]
MVYPVIIIAAIFSLAMAVFFSSLTARYKTAVSLLIYVITCIIYMFLAFSGIPGISKFPMFVIPLIPTFICFKDNPFQKIFVVFTLITVALVLSAVSSILAQLLFPWNSGEYMLAYTVFFAFFCAASIVLTLVFLRRIFSKLFSYTGRRVWALYSLAPLTSFFLLREAIFGYFQIPPPYIQDIPSFLLMVVLILLSLSLVFLAIITTHDRTSVSFALKQAEEALSSSRDYYQMLNKTYEELRIMRHDYKYQLHALSGLLAEKKYAELETLLAGMERILDDTAIPDFSPNPVIGALASWYAGRCRKDGIDFRFRSMLPETPLIDNYDFCVVFGNLLENALDACLLLAPGIPRYIDTDIRCTETQVFIKVKNSFDGYIIEHNGELQTRKTSGGLGIRSIKAACGRYFGDYTTETADKEFTAYVLLNI